jgi:hypothetical protein
MTKFILFLFIVTNTIADTLTLHYDLPLLKVNKNITTATGRCNFICNKIDSLSYNIESRHTQWRANLTLLPSDSSTTIHMVSFSGVKGGNHKLFKELIAEAIDQETYGVKSNYSGSPFKSKDKITYQALSLAAPSIGLLYLTNPPVYPDWPKWVITPLLLGLDALGIWGVLNPDMDISYVKDPNRKHNRNGLYLGSVMLVGLRLLFAFGMENSFEYQKDLEKSGYMFTKWKQ